MPLAAATRLGPYEIVAPLGAGGMGEVYRARDHRLGREVAIKVLPALVAGDPDRLARFEREARLLAALNHPAIAAIYGLEPGDGAPALVMELADGPTLSDRIAAGPLPLDDAFAIARQIAEALEYAHERGIVHRDLKPANVKVSAAGAVKVLDFGLAKALDVESPPSTSSGPRMSQSPTLSQRMTEAGMIIGTAAYMAPEQAKGRAADRRADIWAFGVVFFEMLTGRQLFEGETASETLASVLKDEVPWARLPATAPPAIRRLLERCLTRDPKQRLQAIGEARIALDRPAGWDLGETAAATATVPARRGVPALFIVAAAAIAVASAAAGWWIATARQPAPEVRRYPLTLSGGLRGASDPVISPDGRRAAYFVGESLFVRDLVTLDIHPLARAGSTLMRAFWSPDGREVGYSDGSNLLRVGATGGTPIAIGAIPGGESGGCGAVWTEDGRILMTLGHDGLFEMSVGTGATREIVKPDSTTSDFHEAGLLPGGRGFIFVRHRRAGEADRLAIWNGRAWHDVYSAPEGSIRRPAWSPDGHILFHRTPGHGVWALPLSLATLRPTGDAFPVDVDGGSPSVSRRGQLLYAAVRGSAGAASLTWVDRSGGTTIAVANVGPVNSLALSPDGRRVAVTMSEQGATELWSVDLASGAPTRLTFTPAQEWDPFWTPDGRSILYTDRAEGAIYTIAADGGGQATRLTIGEMPSVSADGRWLCVTRESQATQHDLYLRRLDGDTAVTAILRTPGPESRGVFSPDGRYLAFMSLAGQQNIFLTRVPEGGGLWQVSTRGGRRAIWSHDGRRVYFQTNDGRSVMEADISPGEAPNPGTPRIVFDLVAVGARISSARTFDVAPDGRFLVATMPPRPAGGNDAVLIERWSEGRRK